MSWHQLLANAQPGRALCTYCGVQMMATHCPCPPRLQASEEYFVCAWSLDEASGAPLLLLAGKKGLLLVVNALTGALEVRAWPMEPPSSTPLWMAAQEGLLLLLLDNALPPLGSSGRLPLLPAGPTGGPWLQHQRHCSAPRPTKPGGHRQVSCGASVAFSCTLLMISHALWTPVHCHSILHMLAEQQLQHSIFLVQS